MVPSTPKLAEPRRTDGFAEAVSSPQVIKTTSVSPTGLDTSLSVPRIIFQLVDSSFSKPVPSVADPGCLSRIPVPNFSIPDLGSRFKKIPGFASKNLSTVLQPKKLFLSSRKYGPGCLFQIRILIFNPSRILDPEHCLCPSTYRLSDK